jgi:hypothetical protein
VAQISWASLRRVGRHSAVLETVYWLVVGALLRTGGASLPTSAFI